MIGIIGGTGLYQLDGLTHTQTTAVNTPFGRASSDVTLGQFGGNDVAFLPRHGAQHEFLPGEVNYQANIWALKSVGVTAIVGVSAVGSLTRDITPGTTVFPTQFIDFTKGTRSGSFFGKGLVAHVLTANPVCSVLRQRATMAFRDVAFGEAASVNSKTVTYGCVEGPRLGTAAEGRFLRQAGCDIVGMTNVPEAFLAREAQICYATICIVTDYDSGADEFRTGTTARDIIGEYHRSINAVRTALRLILNEPFENTKCSCRTSLSGALISEEDRLSDEQRVLLEVLKR